jgi:hypothetical protein
VGIQFRRVDLAQISILSDARVKHGLQVGRVGRPPRHAKDALFSHAPLFEVFEAPEGDTREPVTRIVTGDFVLWAGSGERRRSREFDDGDERSTKHDAVSIGDGDGIEDSG